MTTQEKPKQARKVIKCSDEVWACIRAVYESDGKMSIENILAFIQEDLGLENLPKRTSVQSRANKENWERPDNLRHKTHSQLIKIAEKARKELLFVSDDLNININQCDIVENEGEKDYKTRRNEIIFSSMSSVKKLLSTSAKKKKKIADVIRRNRESVDQVRNIVEHVTDELIGSKTLMLSAEFRSFASPEDLEQVERSYGVHVGLIEPLLDLTSAVEKLTKMDVALFGITPEDTREPETDGRMQSLEDDTAYIEQRERLRQQQLAQAERRKYIESGGLAAEVEQEMQERAKALKFDDDDDISEAEFEEITDE